MGSKSSKVLNLFLPIKVLSNHFACFVNKLSIPICMPLFLIKIKSVKLFLRLFAVRNKVSRYDGEIRTPEVRE